MTRAVVYLPDGEAGPGRLDEIELDPVEIRAAEIVLPEATVRDERGGDLFDGDALVFEPAGGGGPLAEAAVDRQARAFGVVNAAFHTQRALRFVAYVLGRPMPRLLVRIGMHNHPHRWSGGHYRLPGPARPAEPDLVNPDGEVHLGGGRAFISTPGQRRYFHAPAHNMAIVYHEVGHHIARHTADFRLNRHRSPDNQISGKTGIDEGSADLITAILLDTPDIYGWHRHNIPFWDQRRRRLDSRWTMAYFRGGRDHDQHADGTVWASACWSARQRVEASGAPRARFDTMFLRGLDLFDRVHEPVPTTTNGSAEHALAEALRTRRHFSRLLSAMVIADPELAPIVVAAMADHGIYPGASNAELRDAARGSRPRQVGA